MTNTYFTAGTDKLDDMIASIEHGYLLESVQSGMEDPKHWGIQWHGRTRPRDQRW